MFVFTARHISFRRRAAISFRAIGLLLPETATLAAAGLIALLVAMFPANVHAARQQLVIAGRRATPLAWRLPLQLFWMGALWAVALR